MSSTPNDLIPQPAQLKRLRRSMDLHPYMMATHPTTQTFRSFVERTGRFARDLGMSREYRSDQIDAAQWQAYVDKVTADRSPLGSKLLLYDRCWPIRVIHELRVEKHLRSHVYQRAKNASKASKSPPSYPRRVRSRSDSSASASTPTPCSLHSASDIKPKTRYVVSREPNVRSTQRRLRSTVTSEDPLPLPPHARIPQTKPASLRNLSPRQIDTATQGSLPASISSCSSAASPPTGAVHVGCLDCGSGPRLVGPSSSLRSGIGAEIWENLRSVLYDGGLVDDAHLKIFCAWPPLVQERFVMDLPATPFVRQIMLQRLGNSAPSRTGCAATGQAPATPSTRDLENTGHGVSRLEPTRSFSGILQPSRELEEVLSDPAQRIELLRSAMELEANPGLFDEVLQFFRRDGFPYLSSFNPSEEEIEKAAKAISCERLLFERYENYWPIRCLIKRVVRKRAPKSMDSCEHWIRPSLQTASQETTETAPTGLPRIVYDCPSHAGPDLSRVSPNIQLLLSRRHLSEFAPVFAYMGIRTDAEFIRFCSFSGKEKNALVESARQHLRRRFALNAFQRVALNLEFTVGEGNEMACSD